MHLKFRKETTATKITSMTMRRYIKAIKNFQLFLQTESESELGNVYDILFLFSDEIELC